MKLLSKTDVKSRLKKENDELLDTNIRLKKAHKTLLDSQNSTKVDYSPDKAKILKEFDSFVNELNRKKAKLLKEYSDLIKAIEEKKDIYYGLIVRQDELVEKNYQLEERETKLNLRERFVQDIEQKQYGL